ncbi:hypothetical protein ACIPRL_10240 [Streptomyces sp. NPDC090085]|uniref:hypothetical protein n=1 Tax=Streptomyces sp. NPDC090085 TaxID=3365943 RepID=UPI00382EB22B
MFYIPASFRPEVRSQPLSDVTGRDVPHNRRIGFHDQDADGSSDLVVLVTSAGWAQRPQPAR